MRVGTYLAYDRWKRGGVRRDKGEGKEGGGRGRKGEGYLPETADVTFDETGDAEICIGTRGVLESRGR